MATRITILPTRIRATDTRRVKPPPKQVDQHYQTPEHVAWAKAIKQRARWRCEEPGCTNAVPQHRMYADHVTELRDGGDPFGPGRCLCAEHHTRKTFDERARRAAQSVD